YYARQVPKSESRCTHTYRSHDSQIVHVVSLELASGERDNGVDSSNEASYWVESIKEGAQCGQSLRVLIRKPYIHHHLASVVFM
ncbi:hypothetical protein PAXRUDRAFT_834204, partial [Paxillus rubicundulus Ve08.2h10]